MIGINPSIESCARIYVEILLNPNQTTERKRWAENKIIDLGKYIDDNEC